MYDYFKLLRNGSICIKFRTGRSNYISLMWSSTFKIYLVRLNLNDYFPLNEDLLCKRSASYCYNVHLGALFLNSNNINIRMWLVLSGFSTPFS